MAEGKQSPMINSGRMRLAEYDRQDWIANIEFGTSVEQIMEPGYWALMASQLKPYDHIEARSEDGSWVAYLIVTGCDRTWARVVVDHVVKLTTSDVSQTEAVTAKHKVEWKGPQHRYSVIRLSDDERIKDGFHIKDEAYAWMREHERVTA